MIDSNENKQKILDNFLKIVSFEGWSKQTLILAFKNSNIDEKLLPIIFATPKKVQKIWFFLNKLKL